MCVLVRRWGGKEELGQEGGAWVLVTSYDGWGNRDYNHGMIYDRLKLNNSAYDGIIMYWEGQTFSGTQTIPQPQTTPRLQ